MEKVTIKKTYSEAEPVSVEICIESEATPALVIKGECTGRDGCHWTDCYDLAPYSISFPAKPNHPSGISAFHMNAVSEAGEESYQGILKTFLVRPGEWSERSILDVPGFGFVPACDEDEDQINDFFAKLGEDVTEAEYKTILLLERERGDHNNVQKVVFSRGCEAGQINSDLSLRSSTYRQLTLLLTELYLPVRGELIIIWINGA